MASDINNFTITGRCTADARLEYTQGGMAICSGSVAVNRTQTGKDGTRKEDVSFFDYKILGKFAENISQYLRKGQETAIEGYLKQDRWQAQDGTNKSRVVLMVTSLKLIGGKTGAQGNNGYDDGYDGSADYNAGANNAFNGGYYGA